MMTRWPSPAKLNLFLYITGRRADGYHTLQTLLQFLDYGDTLTIEPRDDGQLRADMPGGWAGDPANAFSGNGLGDAQQSAQRYIRALFNWRKRTPVLHDGALTHFAPVDGVYVYVRHRGGAAVMVMLNKHDAPRTVALERFDAFLKGRRARLALTGKPLALGSTLEIPAMSATLLETA